MPNRCFNVSHTRKLLVLNIGDSFHYYYYYHYYCGWWCCFSIVEIMQPECTSNEKRHKSVWERETLTKSMKCATSREFDITTTTHTLTKKEERKKSKIKRTTHTSWMKCTWIYYVQNSHVRMQIHTKTILPPFLMIFFSFFRVCLQCLRSVFILSNFWLGFNYWSRCSFPFLSTHFDCCLSVCLSPSLFYATQTHSNAHVTNAHAIFHLNFFSRFCVNFFNFEIALLKKRLKKGLCVCVFPTAAHHSQPQN